MNTKYEMIATTAFGLEAVVKREIIALGCEVTKVEDGRVSFVGDARDIVRANLWLRVADRVLLKIDEFKATDFETLYQRVKGWKWETLLNLDSSFPVQCSTINSKLASEPACQATVKKAIAERMGDFYQVDRLPETGSQYKVRLNLMKDVATITVDTSGEGLHKRGYRKNSVEAPIKETLAAALIDLSFWKQDRLLVDPFCGSGTIAIEAALKGMNIAPGLGREFDCESWDIIKPEIWKEEKRKAFSAIDNEVELSIYASDIDEEAIEAASLNAQEAGVDDNIHFQLLDIADLKPQGKNGIIITNPPYGERIGSETELHKIYSDLGRYMRENPAWSLFAISADMNFEDEVMGRKATRRRKLYNGGIMTQYFQFHGVKPERFRKDRS